MKGGFIRRGYSLGAATAERMPLACHAAHCRGALIEPSHTGPSAVMESNHQSLCGDDHTAVCHSGLSTTVDGKGSQEGYVLVPGERERRGRLLVISPPATEFWNGSFFVFSSHKINSIVASEVPKKSAVGPYE